MKIGIPKIRPSRKLLIITSGIFLLLGGSGAAALYIGSDELLGESRKPVIGGECFDIQTMVLKTPDKRLWLRKYIRMENTDGLTRVRTALRIAGLLAKNNAVDLIHVSVLDAKGPDKRADMRARAIGADVLIAMHPQNLPDMKEPAIARYYEGPVSDEGRFYGTRVSLDLEEIRAMMTSMRSVEEKPDCIKPETPEDAADAKKNEYKKKEAKPADRKKPADGQTEASGEAPEKEQSFIDSMLSMVGFSGSEEPPLSAPTDTEAADEQRVEAMPSGHDAGPKEEAVH